MASEATDKKKQIEIDQNETFSAESRFLSLQQARRRPQPAGAGKGPRAVVVAE